MNKKLAIVFFALQVLIIFTIKAQKKELDAFKWFAQYKMSYKIDSLQKEPSVEYMVLMFNDKISGYRSAGNYLLDSIKETPNYKTKPQMERVAIASKYASNFSEYIRTDLEKKQIVYTIVTLLGNDISAQYTEQVNTKWLLTKDKRKINDVMCSKAEAILFGRKWIAWYSTEHPFPFGPYKFNGLPGLIFEIIDQTGTYHFELYNIKFKHKLYAKNIHENIEKVSKAKSIEMYNTSRYSISVFKGLDDSRNADLLKKLQQSKNKQKQKENNPLELKP